MTVAAANKLASISDVVTYEFENVDADVASALTQQAYVPQGAELLKITQHRLREKRSLQQAGVQVAPYALVSNLKELTDAAATIGLPAVLKTTRGGYDGKNQWVLRTDEDIQQAGRTLTPTLTITLAAKPDKQSDDGLAPYVLEGFVPFVKELSVIVARSVDGQMETFPVAENVHVNGILQLSMVPARVSAAVMETADRMARQVAESVGVVGLLAVEMFLTADDTLFVNELAPRPHNSGHYTMDACNVSQFEQHLRAICGWRMAVPELLTPVVMVNILGQHMEDVIQASPFWPGNVRLHLYGKAESKTGRKMGHVNVLADTVEEALATIDEVGIWRSLS